MRVRPGPPRDPYVPVIRRHAGSCCGGADALGPAPPRPGQPVSDGCGAAFALSAGCDRLWNVDRDELLRVLRAFEGVGLEYVLIGATAMGFHGLVRATEDVDLFVRATPDNVERLRAALGAVYDDPHIQDIRTEDLLGEYPSVRYYPPTGDLYFDVLTRLGEGASFDTVAAETMEIEGIHVRVATPAALYDLKRGTVRAIDRQDAAALRERFNLGQEE